MMKDINEVSAEHPANYLRLDVLPRSFSCGFLGLRKCDEKKMG